MSSRRRSVLLVAIAAAGTAACSSSFGAPDPASQEGDEILGLWRGTVVAALVVGVVVWGLIGWALLRYRRRDDVMPGQRASNLPIEVIYTAIPVLIVAGLFFFTLRTQQDVTKLSDSPDVTVEVVGFQWQWQFRYSDDVVVTGDSAGEPPELVLPVDRTIRLRLVADDVNHSFWVPRFLSKRDLIPGVRNEIDVNPSTLGTFVGRCAEFCGLDHWRMHFTVRVVSEADFQRWLRSQGDGGS